MFSVPLRLRLRKFCGASLPLCAIFTIVLASATGALAAEGDSAGGASTLDGATPAVQAPDTNKTTGTASGNGTLQGGVATTEADAEAILGELEQTVHHVKDSASGAFNEAQRANMVYAGGPNVVGSIVINPIGIGGFLPTGGYLPVRKKWIDYFAMHVEYLAPILKQELESFALPPGVSSDTQEEYVEYKKLGSRLPDLCDKMIAACKGPKYDNMTIAMAAGMLDEELKRYDKQRKTLLRDIKEDYKRKEK